MVSEIRASAVIVMQPPVRTVGVRATRWSLNTLSGSVTELLSTIFPSQHYCSRMTHKFRDMFPKPEIFSSPWTVSHNSNWAIKGERTIQKGRLQVTWESISIGPAKSRISAPE